MELKHFIDTQDFTKKELLDLIELIRRIKQADKQGASPKLLQDASLAMLFEEPSTRTRISFEVGITELGGHALYLKPGEIHLGVRESLADTAKVISRYVDVIMARTLKHETILSLARSSTGSRITTIPPRWCAMCSPCWSIWSQGRSSRI